MCQTAHVNLTGDNGGFDGAFGFVFVAAVAKAAATEMCGKFRETEFDLAACQVGEAELLQAG